MQDIENTALAGADKCAFPGCGNKRVLAPGLKFCKDHRQNEIGRLHEKRKEIAADEKQTHVNTEIQKEQRRVRRTRALKKNTHYEWDSLYAPDDEQALECLLSERGIQNLHVAETLVDLWRTCAKAQGFTPNFFSLVNGRAKMLESIAAGEPRLLEPVSTDQARGMPVTMRDLHALYDYSPFSWAPIKWPLDTFEEFRNIDWDFTEFIERNCQNPTLNDFHGLRYCSMTNTLWSGRWIHGKDFWPSPDGPHDEWERLTPKMVPTLPLEYTTEDIKKWLEGLTDGPRRFMLNVSRNSYKSSWQVCSVAIPFLLACPSATILEISAVKRLAAKFIKNFREYWTVRDKRNPTIFQSLWPEMTIHIDDQSDSRVFNSPMSRHLYPQDSMASSSVDASQTGERALMLIFDDSADDENSAKSELREALIEKIGLIEKLKEPMGFELIIGTPQASEGDLYQVVLERSAKAGHKHLSYLIQPAYTLKLDSRSKSVYDIGPDDIESFLFPRRLSFEFLRSELLSDSEKTFRRQYLVEWIDDKDPSLQLHFSREMFERHRIPAVEMPADGDFYITGDIGLSKSPYRDPSCFTCHKTVKDVLYVMQQSTGHWNTSEKAEEIVRLSRLYPRFTRAILEKYPAFDDLDKEIKRLAMLQNISVPVFWLEPDTRSHAKFYRLKNHCEFVVSGGKVKFVMPETGSNMWLEDLILEVLKLDNTGEKRKSSTIKDDRADSLSLACRLFLKSENDPDQAAREKMEAEARDAQERDQAYERIFGVPRGSEFMPQKKTPTESEEYADLIGKRAMQESPLMRILSQNGRVADPKRKPMSFDFMNKKPINDGRN